MSTDIVENVIPDTNRLVWVLSNLKVPAGHDPLDFWYEETFRSDLIKIPPNEEKRVLMHFLAAQRFLGATALLSEPFPNGGFVHPETGRVDKTRFGKPLKIVELTSEERERFEGLSAEQASKRAQEIEEELQNKDIVDKSIKANAIAVGKGKPQAQKTRRSYDSSKPAGVMFEDIQQIDGN